MENGPEDNTFDNSNPEIIEGEFEVIENFSESELGTESTLQHEVDYNKTLVKELDESLDTRYFEGSANENLLDPRIVSYFRDYLGPEETVRIIELMNQNETLSRLAGGPDNLLGFVTFEDLTRKISEGDFEGVVEMMERYKNGTDSYFDERLRGLEAMLHKGDFSFDNMFTKKQGVDNYDLNRLEAIDQVRKRDNEIKNIIDDIKSRFQ